MVPKTTRNTFAARGLKGKCNELGTEPQETKLSRQRKQVEV